MLLLYLKLFLGCKKFSIIILMNLGPARLRVTTLVAHITQW